MTEYEPIWLTERRHFAWLINLGAYYSTIMWTDGGIDYEEVIPNDEFEFWEDRSIGYESD